ncbi:hypothetical protein FRC10_002412 [Ceratobasidium sp. 414]|nr:hypothetical protein FRC10_002412 [Ceratobasidium sp. 414]
MSSPSQESSLRHHPLFRSMEDFDFWEQCLAVQDAQPVGQFILLFLKHRRGAPCTGADQLLTNRSLWESFNKIETDFLARVQEGRASLVGEANRARDDCQKAEDAAQAAQNALDGIMTQHNYLLQHLNIGDNTELSDVVHHFRSLNDEIDGFSMEVVQIIPGECFERYSDCTNCHNPGGLRQLLGQSNRPLLLLQSRTGVPMATRQFLELFSASTICSALCAEIFWPFYPLGLKDPNASVRLETLTAVYNNLRLQNQQMASAKWRIEAYSSLVKLDSMRDGRIADISAHIATIINQATFHLFGGKINLLANRARLVKLVTRALDLNHIIKAQVAHAGDIHAEHFHFNHEYDSSRMEVLDAKKDDPLPKHIVSTCGLGVCLKKAVGGGKEPELTVLLKAVVSSEDIYV